jgi:hypothetical protein
MPTLDEEYTQAITEQRNYLAQIQEAFKKQCESINAETQTKLSTLPENDIAGRQAVFEAQKKKLEESLAQLKTETDRSMAASRKKLEEIHSRREAFKLTELEQLMTK